MNKSFDFSGVARVPKKDEKKESASKKGDGDAMKMLSFAGTGDEKGKKGLNFTSGKEGGANPFSGDSKKGTDSKKGSMFSGFSSGAKGVEAYIPKGSEIEAFLNGKLAKGEAKSTVTRSRSRDAPKLRAELSKAHEIREIEMSGIAFERIFSMPGNADSSENMGEMFRRRIHVDVQ